MTRYKAWLVGGLLVACIAPACDLVLGIHDVPVPLEAMDGSLGDAAVIPPDGSCDSGGFGCVAAPPPNWNGPVAILAVDGGTNPSCAGAYGVAAIDGGHAGLIAPPATCTCCNAPPAGASCGNIHLDEDDSTCNVLSSIVLDGGCNFVGNPARIRATVSLTQQGACTINSSKTTTTDWQTSFAVCGYDVQPTTGACPSGALCMAMASPMCIWQAGDTTCPAGPYSQLTVMYVGVDDTRDCSACVGCTPSGGSCSGQVNLFKVATCSTTPDFTIGADGGCAVNQLSASPSYGRQAVTVQPGSCTSEDGGSPVGAATPATPVTLCCTP